MIKEEALCQIGLFTKPHGVKGEIALITDYDIAEMAYIVCNIDDILVPFFIQSYRQKSASTVLVTFDRLDTEDKVKFLMGKTAYIPSELASSINPASSTPHDLTGYTVVDEQSGILGTLKDIDDSTLNILLKVDRQGAELLIPLALVTSTHSLTKTINVSLPDGFLNILEV